MRPPDVDNPRTRAAALSPNGQAAVRRALVTGPRGAALGLDLVPGIVWVRIVDHGRPGVQMPKGQAHVEVWGGDAGEVFLAVERHKPRDALVTVRWYPTTRWARLKRWARWTIWRWTIGRRVRG